MPCDCSHSFRWVNYVGHALIKTVDVEIGGQRIDRHYGDWLNIWNELTQEPGHQVGYDNMVGNTIALTGTGLSRTEATTLYIPLQFWFCRNPGLALPLIALQYHEVRFIFELRNKTELYVTSAPKNFCGSNCEEFQAVCVPSLESVTLFIDYIYLDTDERRRFAQVTHEYLIEQLQFTGDESTVNTNVKVKLNFNHPTKEIVWVVQRDDVLHPAFNQWTNYTDDFDLDTNWCDEPCFDECGNLDPQFAHLAVNTNIESGYSARSFPYVGISAMRGCGCEPACCPTGTPEGSGASACCDAGVGTNSVAQGLLKRGVNFPPNFGNGPLSNALAPIDFSSNVGSAAEGADHAGLAPLNAGRNPTVRAKLQLNGHDRFQERLGSYFNLVQPYQHHTNIPATGINVYSFALAPEEHQPSGTCNFSRIDNATLQLQLTNKAARGSKIRVYAFSYNVLRIMSGINDIFQKVTEVISAIF